MVGPVFDTRRASGRRDLQLVNPRKQNPARGGALSDARAGLRSPLPSGQLSLDLIAGAPSGPRKSDWTNETSLDEFARALPNAVFYIPVLAKFDKEESRKRWRV